MRLVLALTLLALPACTDETISGYADPDATYRLTEVGGAAFPAAATISFPEEGTVRGNAPCNAYTAIQTVPYPWFALGPIAVTRRACPELDAETRFLATLQTMAFAEVQGPVLILSADDGTEMIFDARP